VNLGPWFSRLALWIRLREAKEEKEIHCSLGEKGEEKRSEEEEKKRVCGEGGAPLFGEARG